VVINLFCSASTTPASRISSGFGSLFEGGIILGDYPSNVFIQSHPYPIPIRECWIQTLIMFMQNDFYQTEPDVVAAVMTQLSLKSGVKECGDRAYAAAEAEMKQLHFRNTFEPLH
jgi:hypothetical protein